MGSRRDARWAGYQPNKTPTLTQGGYELQPLSLNLSLLDAFKGEARRRIAYERLLLEAISNNSTLFVRRDEAEAAWQWIDGIIEGWSRVAMSCCTCANAALRIWVSV